MKTYKTRTAFGIKCYTRHGENGKTKFYSGESDDYLVKIYDCPKNVDVSKFHIELLIKRFRYFTIDGNGTTLKEAMTDIRNQFEALTGEFSALSDDVSDRTWKVCN